MTYSGDEKSAEQDYTKPAIVSTAMLLTLGVLAIASIFKVK